MPSGLQLWGDHGFIQIDDSQLTLQLKASGSTTASGVGNPDTVLSFGGITFPMLCLRNLNGSTGILGVRSSNIGNGTVDYRVTAPTGTPFAWYLYDIPVYGSNTGIQLFREDGTLSFSGDQFPMKIVAGTAVPSGSVRNNYQGAAVGSPTGAGVYAGCLVGPRAYYFQPDGPPKIRHLEGIRTDSSAVYTGVITAPGPSGIYSTDQGGTLLLVDVANIPY